MFETLSIFRTAQAMAVHAGARQNILAQNMANADTPGFTARDLQPFSNIAKGTLIPTQLRATRATHLAGAISPTQTSMVERSDARDPNGNSVSLETEMMHAVDTKRQHDRALGIYKSSLRVLRTSLGRS